MKLCEIHLRDPFVFAENGVYYLYGTRRGATTKVIAAADKVITVTAEGLAVIAPAAVEDGDVLTTLYRALM